MSIQGIDVSFYQGIIDWAAVKASGIQFAILRAGYGLGNVDEQFNRNARECNRLGIPFGVYWFSYAYTEAGARQEADYCIQVIKDFEVQYPVAFDYESASVDYAASHGVNVTPELASRLVNVFCRRVEELGYFAMYYSNLNFLNQMFDASLQGKYALWFARYAQEPGLNGQAMWQYSSTGSVPGINGNVDMDIAYYDIANVISKAGLNRLKGEVVTPPPGGGGSVLIYTVRRGDTLGGIAARYGTTYQAIATYNGITNPNRIYIGQQLKIPAGGSGGEVRTYTIRPGDTLSGIAQRFGTTVQELQRLNQIQNPNRIYAGQVIRIG